MLVGVDFDNTIVCYDRVFYLAALNQGLIPKDLTPTKGEVRDFLRQADKENQWTELQGYVYGVMIAEAEPFPGVLDFFRRCRAQQVPICIVSHKTRYPFEGPRYDLHLSARSWLERQGFFDPHDIGLSPHLVHFELTKQGKIDRIASLGCTHFIDDLPEFFEENPFPSAVSQVLFDPGGYNHQTTGILKVRSWREMADILLGGKPTHS